MVTKYGQTDAQLGYNQPVHAVAKIEDSDAKPSVNQQKLGKFEIYQSVNNDQWYFHLKARNGEIIAVSEGYASKKGALTGIESIKKNSQTKRIIEI